MRLWSLHPKYLDTKGLVALWREALLAKHVLEGRTKGYVHHPQLARFRKAEHPVDVINQYLAAVYEEAVARNYKFDNSKIDMHFIPTSLPVKSGQVNYEKGHLLEKLKIRDTLLYKKLMEEDDIETHPLFEVIDGGVEEWEVGGKIFPGSSL